MGFNSLTPCGVKLSMHSPIGFAYLFQFTHPLRGETQATFLMLLHLQFQFTHPLRGETLMTNIVAELVGFNSLTPGGVRLQISNACASVILFQFTHPLRGETCNASGLIVVFTFQFTHPLRGETLLNQITLRSQQFQFTHPLRGETY